MTLEEIRDAITTITSPKSRGNPIIASIAKRTSPTQQAAIEAQTAMMLPRDLLVHARKIEPDKIEAEIAKALSGPMRVRHAPLNLSVTLGASGGGVWGGATASDARAAFAATDQTGIGTTFLWPQNMGFLGQQQSR